MNFLLNWIKQNSNFWINFWIEFSGKIDYGTIHEQIDIYWIESAEFSLSWITFWNESWVNWIEYWMNHFWQNSNIELNQIGYRGPLVLREGLINTKVLKFIPYDDDSVAKSKRTFRICDILFWLFTYWIHICEIAKKICWCTQYK